MADDPFHIADHQAGYEGRQTQGAQVALGHLGGMGKGGDADNGCDSRIAGGLEQGGPPPTEWPRTAMRPARLG